MVDLPDGPAPEIDDPISEAELEDLKTIASQYGMSLQAAIDRYAWNDNFALAVAYIREASPEAFADAKIVDADNVWIAFKGGVPQAASEIIDIFEKSHAGVAVGVRTDWGFTQLELEVAIPKVHYAILGSPQVRHATTSYDETTRTVTTTVVLDDTAAESLLDDLQVVAVQSLVNASRKDILDSIGVSVVRSTLPIIGGDEDSSKHLGGELLSPCTSGFTTITSGGTKGVATAGHGGCNDNPQNDDGATLNLVATHIGTHGDFAWFTGSQPKNDDFYSGSSSTTETALRDVVNIGSLMVGQALCRNGKATHKKCDEVRKLNICNEGACNLVETKKHLSTDGDSGGPWYYSGTAYGIHQGWIDDDGAERSVFSRTDRIDNAFGIFINS